MQEDAETELKRQQLVLEQKVQAAEVKFREVEEQNGLLHSQLVRVAEQQASTEHAAADGLNHSQIAMPTSLPLCLCVQLYLSYCTHFWLAVSFLTALWTR